MNSFLYNGRAACRQISAQTDLHTCTTKALMNPQPEKNSCINSLISFIFREVLMTLYSPYCMIDCVHCLYKYKVLSTSVVIYPSFWHHCAVVCMKRTDYLILVQCLALLPHSMKVLGSGPFSVEFACASHASVGFLQVLQFPPPPKTCTYMYIYVHSPIRDLDHRAGLELELVLSAIRQLPTAHHRWVKCREPFSLHCARYAPVPP